jgi:hypothetical protein
MVTALATEKFFANNCMESFIHMTTTNATEQSVKAGTTATTWRAMRDYEGFAVIAVQSVLGGSGMIELSIYAATDASASNATEIKTTGVVACDAIGDYTVLEVSAEEIAQLGAAAGYNFTHVTAYIDCQHNDDEVAVTYVRYGAKRPVTGLTAETISE